MLSSHYPILEINIYNEGKVKTVMEIEDFTGILELRKSVTKVMNQIQNLGEEEIPNHSAQDK